MVGIKSIIKFNPSLALEKGIPNYAEYSFAVTEMIDVFISLFDVHQNEDIICKYNLYIDNGTDYTGNTIVAFPIFDNFIHIKTKITDGLDTHEVLYQMGFTLSQVVCYSLLGLDKPKADEQELMLSYAMGLCAVATGYPDYYLFYENGGMGENKMDPYYYRAVALVNDNNHKIEKVGQMLLDYCLEKRKS